MAIPSPFDSLQIPSDLVCVFFAVFSRFEFALKELGFVYVNRHGRAAPNWEGFTTSFSGSLRVDPGTDLHRAIDFLNRESPQIQVSAQDWKSVPLRGMAPVGTALDAAQRVRHNLFHGGKYTPHSTPGRDEALVHAALNVLLACVAQNSNLAAVYA